LASSVFFTTTKPLDLAKRSADKLANHFDAYKKQPFGAIAEKKIFEVQRFIFQDVSKSTSR